MRDVATKTTRLPTPTATKRPAPLKTSDILSCPATAVDSRTPESSSPLARWSVTRSTALPSPGFGSAPGPPASIATVILLGAPKDGRLALPNARLLIHQPLIPMTVYGPASDLEITATEILKTRSRINRLLAEETGQSLERIEHDTQRDYWLTATEAVEYGLISRVVANRDEV